MWNQVKHHFQRPVVAAFKSCHSMKTGTSMQDISGFSVFWLCEFHSPSICVLPGLVNGVSSSFLISQLPLLVHICTSDKFNPKAERLVHRQTDSIKHKVSGLLVRDGNASVIRLHSFFLSNCCIRLRIMVNLQGVPGTLGTSLRNNLKEHPWAPSGNLACFWQVGGEGRAYMCIKYTFQLNDN